MSVLVSFFSQSADKLNDVGTLLCEAGVICRTPKGSPRILLKVTEFRIDCCAFGFLK